MCKTRLIDRPGVLNMRDLGGLRTGNGHLSRRGLVFRTASLAEISVDDAAALKQELGIITYIDFRSGREIKRDGRPDNLINLNVAWIHLPIDEGKTSYRMEIRPKPSDYVSSYIQMIPKLKPAFRLASELIADGSQTPVAFGCTVGKDRSGVVSGLLLAALGVPDQEICADYALTARCLRNRLEALHKNYERKELTPSDYARRLETRKQTMQGFLNACRTRYGSIPNLLNELELSARTIKGLKDQFVELPSGLSRNSQA